MKTEQNILNNNKDQNYLELRLEKEPESSVPENHQNRTEPSSPSKSTFRKFIAENSVGQRYIAQPPPVMDIIDVLEKYKYDIPVRAAARANDQEAVKVLLAHGADCQKALEGAIQGQSILLVQYLIKEAGSSIQIISPNNKVPYFDLLYNAVGWWEGFDYFLTQGARIPSQGERLMDRLINEITSAPNSRFLGNDIYELFKRGDHIRLNEDIFSRLYNSGFNSQKRIDIIKGFIACNLGLSIAETKFHIQRDPEYPNWGKKIGTNVRICTPLLFAVARNDLELAELLLRTGAHTNLAMQEHYSPLNIANWEGNREMMALLIKYGAKP